MLTLKGQINSRLRGNDIRGFHWPVVNKKSQSTSAPYDKPTDADAREIFLDGDDVGEIAHAAAAVFFRNRDT